MGKSKHVVDRKDPFEGSGYLLLKDVSGLVIPVYSEYELYKKYREGYKLANLRKLGKHMRRARKAADFTREEMVSFLLDRGLNITTYTYMLLEKGELRHQGVSISMLPIFSRVLHKAIKDII